MASFHSTLHTMFEEVKGINNNIRDTNMSTLLEDTLSLVHDVKHLEKMVMENWKELLLDNLCFLDFLQIACYVNNLIFLFVTTSFQ